MPVASPSNGFIDTLRFGSYLAIAQIVVTEYSPSGSAVQTFNIPCSGANITIDRNSAIRRSGQITVQLVPSVPPPTLMPTAPGQPLTPFGNEVNVAVGITLSATTTSPNLAQKAAQNATILEVENLGSNPAIALNDTISVGNAQQVTVVGITAVGDHYQLTISAGLSAAQPSGTAVTITQFVSLGEFFTITTTTVSDTTTNLVITLDISDRSFVIDQRQLIAPYAIPATPSGTFGAEIEAIVSKVWYYDQATGKTIAGMPAIGFIQSGETVSAIVPPNTYNQGESPWQVCLDMAQVVGAEAYIDRQGRVMTIPYPNPQTTAVSWYFTDDEADVVSTPLHDINSGSPYTVPIGTQVTFTRSIFNDVYITGGGTSNVPGTSTSASTATGGVSTSTAAASTSASASSPVLAQAADQNPNSSTYVLGFLGDLPDFFSSNITPTTAQAIAMAEYQLALQISSAWKVQISASPNPLFDIDDVMSVTREILAMNGTCVVLDTITLTVSYGEVVSLEGRVLPGRYAPIPS